jgi:hypothetical protein
MFFRILMSHTASTHSIYFGHNFNFGSLKSKWGIILLPIVTIFLHRPIDDFVSELETTTEHSNNGSRNATSMCRESRTNAIVVAILT